MDVAEGRVAPPKTAPGFANVAKKWANEARNYAIIALRKSGNRDALAFVERVQTSGSRRRSKNREHPRPREENATGPIK